MTARKIKTKQEDKLKALEYLKKAEDNYAQMLAALENENYNAVGTLAVQCEISSADAICIYEKGIRSVSRDHLNVCYLVKSIPLPEAKEKSNILKRIITKKNLVQYEGRSMYKNEAQEIAKATKRFFQWVYSSIKS